MQLWPAIDIKQGRCVRLAQGDFGLETRFGDPLDVALQYVSRGARRLHVVDLDGARTGSPANRDLVAQISGSAGVPVQVGGGVRSREAAEALFDLGAARVVVGTAAVEVPDLLASMAERWPGRVVAGIDYRHRGAGSMEVAVRGWAVGSGEEVAAVLGRMGELPLAGVAATDIGRDGMGSGPDLVGLAAILGWTALAVVASGGVGGAGDLGGLREVAVGGRRLDGVIVGKALLSGDVSLEDAAAAAEGIQPAGEPSPQELQPEAEGGGGGGER